MKIKDLLEYVDELQENVFSKKVKIRWINQLEAEVQTEILLLAAEGITQYTTDDMETELIVPAPHDQIYQEYLFWQIALAQGEAERANNASVLFNRVLQEYKRFVAMTINPALGNAEVMRYYLSAYQLAVKAGYSGTLEEWLLSLHGPKGETGAGLNIKLQVASEDELPAWGEAEDGYGVLVGEGTDALLYIWDGERWFYKTALSAKGDPGKDGFSPTVKTYASPGGHTVCIRTEKDEKSFFVPNGKDANIYIATAGRTYASSIAEAVRDSTPVCVPWENGRFLWLEKADINSQGNLKYAIFSDCFGQIRVEDGASWTKEGIVTKRAASVLGMTYLDPLRSDYSLELEFELEGTSTETGSPYNDRDEGLHIYPILNSTNPEKPRVEDENSGQYGYEYHYIIRLSEQRGLQLIWTSNTYGDYGTILAGVGASQSNGAIPQTLERQKLYRLKMEKRGDTLRIKAWEKGTAEPEWQIEHTDAATILNDGCEWQLRIAHRNLGTDDESAIISKLVLTDITSGKDFYDGPNVDELKDRALFDIDGGSWGSYTPSQSGGSTITAEKIKEVLGYTPLQSESDPTVPAWAKSANKPSYTASEVGADPSGTANTKVSQHNVAEDSHNDIRLLISDINARLNAFFDSDDATLDELSEIVAYIKSNKSLIDAVTTSKVSVADVVNNLATNVANKPLSAAQGVVLKGLIDDLTTSLSGYQPKGDYALRSELPDIPVQSVNGKTGAVKLTAEDVGARDSSWMPTAENITSTLENSGDFLTFVATDTDGNTHTYVVYGKEDNNVPV